MKSGITRRSTTHLNRRQANSPQHPQRALFTRESRPIGRSNLAKIGRTATGTILTIASSGCFNQPPATVNPSCPQEANVETGTPLITMQAFEAAHPGVLGLMDTAARSGAAGAEARKALTTALAEPQCAPPVVPDPVNPGDGDVDPLPPGPGPTPIPIAVTPGGDVDPSSEDPGTITPDPVSPLPTPIRQKTTTTAAQVAGDTNCIDYPFELSADGQDTADELATIQWAALGPRYKTWTEGLGANLTSTDPDDLQNTAFILRILSSVGYAVSSGQSVSATEIQTAFKTAADNFAPVLDLYLLTGFAPNVGDKIEEDLANGNANAAIEDTLLLQAPIAAEINNPGSTAVPDDIRLANAAYALARMICNSPDAPAETPGTGDEGGGGFLGIGGIFGGLDIPGVGNINPVNTILTAAAAGLEQYFYDLGYGFGYLGDAKRRDAKRIYPRS